MTESHLQTVAEELKKELKHEIVTHRKELETTITQSFHRHAVTVEKLHVHGKFMLVLLGASFIFNVICLVAKIW